MIDNKEIVKNIYEDKIVSPCNVKCPAHINIPGYISLIMDGKEEEAYHLIRNNNPFPAVTGRVCPHPCEQVCRRADFDKAVSICMLKAFAADKIQQFSPKIEHNNLPLNGKSVGIVGSGPAGLTCAYYLTQKGYDVHVYEASSVPGGMIAKGIPEFRIPMVLLQWEIEMIRNVGFKIHLNTKIGKDISYTDLEKKYKALFLAFGLPKGKSIGLQGEDAKGFFEAVDFLRDVKLALYEKKPLPKIGKKIIVLGGGNVAVDVVRTVRRMGVSDIQMLCIEQRKEMPAWESEVNEALEEGACLENGWGPDKILVDASGTVTGVTFKECLHVFDSAGKFNPQYCVDHVMTIEADTVIKAFGQSPDVECIKNQEGFQYFRNQWLISDPITKHTGRVGIFAGGDMIKPGLLIDAIADGRAAAKSIDKYLGGTGILQINDSFIIPKPDLNWKTHPIIRAPIHFISMEDREATFKESALLLDKTEALSECERCLNCEVPLIDQIKCMGCGTCVKSCPYEAITFSITIELDFFGEKKIRKAKIDPSKCHTCTVCFTECPINAISMQKWGNSNYFQYFRDLDDMN